MGYAIKEIFYSLQGEGWYAGRAAVFCRFSGCNLWSGREVDRSQATCSFCDTDFVGTDGIGGGHYPTPTAVASAVSATWVPEHVDDMRLVVCTGGEPLLQLDDPLIDALHAEGFEIALETNGTRRVPSGIDHVCVSPKAGTNLLVTAGNALKLVFPQAGAKPEQFDGLDFDAFYLQPMDGPARDRNTEMAVRYCLAHPRWRLSLQIHKYVGIP